MPKPENQRRIVLEQIEFSGNPLAPADGDFALDPDPLGEDEGAGFGLSQRIHFPTIGARLVIPVPERAHLVRQEPLFSVHYNLLALASLSDYNDPVVRYTAWGLIRDMGWKYGGRQTALLRRCIEYLNEMKLEIAGHLPDPGLPGISADQIYELRILIGRSYPTREERRSGGRNMSHVEYHPRYLRALRQMRAVQIDIAVMSQITGGLARSFYRTASFLRHSGRDRIDLDELFARVGSNRQRVIPAVAHRVFGPAYQVMKRYRYIRGFPTCEPNGRGGFTMIFDWGEPIKLPTGGDQLFRAYTDVGVDARAAADMISTDPRRALAVMQAYHQGALPAPRETVAGLLVGCFRDPAWELHGINEPDPQTHLQFDRQVSRAAPAPPPPAGPEIGLHWDALRTTPGGWEAFRGRVLAPLLTSAGDNPSRAFGIKPLMERLERAFGRAGWHTAVDVAQQVAPYLSEAARPASYLATVLEKEAPALPMTHLPASGTGAASPPRAQRGSPSRIDINPSRFLVHTLDTWVEELRENPTRDTARRALDFVRNNAAKIEAADLSPVAAQLTAAANGFLAGAPPTQD